MSASTNYDHVLQLHNAQQAGSSAAYPGFFAVVTGHGEDAPGAATKYLANPGENHAAAQVKLFVAPRACTIQNLVVACQTVPGGSDTGIITVQKSTDKGANWTNTALTATIPAAGTTTYDSTNRVAIAAGDMLAIKNVSSGATLAKVTCSFEVA